MIGQHGGAAGPAPADFSFADPVFTDSADDLASAEDVVMCYQILLGRNPENSFVIEEARSQTVRRLVMGFLRSKEFTDRVTIPLDNGRKLAHETDSIGPMADQVDWFLGKLVVPGKIAARLLAAPDWRSFFGVLMHAPEMEPDPDIADVPSQSMQQAERLASLHERLADVEHLAQMSMQAVALLRAELEQFSGE